ncbi:unnamed protein product [Triticum turgidum subsp. durum]|uniref:Tf2-1-like SH3-like domain-containing protein n=1 Tax=Triticum turgidum subsp. durum TaxID=4567 RepID=A0A9R0T8P8_TRITD|nr:unnamed protein product [Triticum turgidum subsp. durum]
MKNQVDKKRSDRVFQVGDYVFLKLQPYIQSSVAPRAHHKLLFKYYGPFQVLERIGDVAYRLLLPPGSRIHPVIHVSQLKKALGEQYKVEAELPPASAALAVPVKVLQRRFRQEGHSAVPQGLIQWSGQSEDLATWEDLDELKQRFPRATAWGQAVLQGRGNVSNRSIKSTAKDDTSQVRNDHVNHSSFVADSGPSKRIRRPSTRYAGKEWATCSVK